MKLGRGARGSLTTRQARPRQIGPRPAQAASHSRDQAMVVSRLPEAIRDPLWPRLRGLVDHDTLHFMTIGVLSIGGQQSPPLASPGSPDSICPCSPRQSPGLAAPSREFQDVDAAQLRIIRLLAAPEDNLYCRLVMMISRSSDHTHTRDPRPPLPPVHFSTSAYETLAPL
jgi:hypothetical protein